MKLPLKFSSEPVNQSERDRLLAEVTSKKLSGKTLATFCKG